ncbi:MAG: hexose kinase [Anaerolineae bacterium]|nr:hexose kinase [Anaerolineae bacterium]
MILTVTLHTALDKVIFIDEWTPGLPMRTNRVLTCVGGKGLDSSIVLSQMGVATSGLCFVAGKTGADLIDLVHTYGAATLPIWVNGETRTAHVIVETRHNRHSHLITGALEIAPSHWQQLLDAFDRNVPLADWVICAGSLPANMPDDFFATLTHHAHSVSVPILIDSSTHGIRSALPARPDILKMNRDEFSEAFGTRASSLEELVTQAQSARRQFDLPALVITCGVDGILAFTSEESIHAAAPPQQAVNAAGAGDAASAALAWRRSLGEDWQQALRWAAAVSAAAVLTEGTAEIRQRDVHDILPQVLVRRISTNSP